MAVLRRLLDVLPPWRGWDRPTLALSRLSGLAAYRAHLAAVAAEVARRRALERNLARAGEEAGPFTVPGHCYVCRGPVAFRVEWSYSYPVDGIPMPNWREHLLCPGCHLNNRMRATIHLFRELFSPPRDAAMYFTEQTTPLFSWFAAHHRRAVGSEYLGDAVEFGERDERGIRNESLTRLTFAADGFDFVISLDVFEHVPDYRRAAGECLRVLRPGGSLLFTVPFRPDYQENLVRAVVREDGAIDHLLPPEYHGDPLSTAGCLAFYCFGWELLDQLREIGFQDVASYLYWSRGYGYLGSNLLLFTARKPAA